jgi:hypothetical protein
MRRKAMTTRRRRSRLWVDSLDTVGIVDKGDDPAAQIVFMKARGISKQGTLEQLVLQLREQVSGLMQSHQGDLAAAGNVRDLAICRVLAGNPDLHQAIEAAARGASLEKAKAANPLVAKRQSADEAVTALSRALAPGDPKLGVRLVAKHFPELHARWLGVD